MSETSETSETNPNNDEFDEMILCPLFEAAEQSADLPAVVDRSQTFSFAQYERLTRHYTEMLRAVEPPPGQYFVFYERNRLELPAALFACWRVGGVAVLLNHRYPPSAAFEQIDFAPNLYRVFFGGDDTEVSDSIPAIELDPWQNVAASTGHTLPQIELDQPASVMFTSGSTGRSKAVLHSFGNHYYSALGSNTNITITPGDRWLLSLPLYHVGGLAIVLRCVLGHGTFVIARPGDDFVALIEQHHITHVSLVATQLLRLVETLEQSPRSLGLKCVLLGGGPTPAPLVERALRLKLPLYRSYGLTEMASQVITSSQPDGTKRIVLPHREVKLSESSEILVRGKTRFLGYLERDTFLQPFDGEGWFATGDIGQMTDDGLKVLGRVDNAFISGGENIHPEEIERALLDIEGVEQALVVPVEDPEFGHRPVAFVETKETTEKLAAQLRLQLPGYKIPIRFFPWPDEASSSGLKPDRRALSELAQSYMRS